MITKEQAHEMQDRVNAKKLQAERIEKAGEYFVKHGAAALAAEFGQKKPHVGRAPKTGTTVGAKPERASGAAMAGPQTATQRTQALGRLPKGVMNNTERAYARHLEALKFAGEILDYWFEEIKFKIGTSACWYEPDFLVQVKGGAMEIHECKGHWQDDALVKIKALALRYPFRVIAVRLVKGNWEIREFN